MNGLELGKKALALFRQVRGSQSLDQQCQRLSGYYTQWAYQGTEAGIITYPSANAAAAASPRDGSQINEMPVGGFAYWNVGPFGHVAQCIGYDGKRALILHTSRQGDTVLELDPFWRVSHADTYPHPFMFWSFTNGRNPRMTVTPWSPNPTPGPRQRVVGAKGVHARLDPSTGQPSQGLVAAGAIVDMVGYVTNGAAVQGNAIWYKSAKGQWFWSGGFTNAAPTSLDDLTPPPVVPEPEPEPVTPDPVEPEPTEPEQPPTPEPDPEPVDPDPVDPPTDPTPPTEPDPPKEPPMPTLPTVPVPDAPDVILPANVRSVLYLSNWGLGVALTAVVVGYAAAETAPPTAVLVAIAVYGVLSSAVSALARANTRKTPTA